MSPDPAVPAATVTSRSADDRGPGFYGRLGVWLGLVLSWLVMLLYLWSAFATLPSAERLEQTRTAAIPTLRSLALLGARSAVELCVLLALLWPWRRRAWVARVAAAAVLLIAWFVLTTPLTLPVTDWVHRRWLAGVTAGLVLTSIIALMARAVLAGTRRDAAAP